MGNINQIGKDQRIHLPQEQSQKEVKGLASSEETRGSTIAASEAQQSTMFSRALLIEKFGKEVGNDLADALDKIKLEGKFLSFQAVKALIKTAFQRNRKDFNEYEKEIENISNLVSHEFVITKKKEENEDFAALAANEMGELRKKEFKSSERMEEKLVEEDRKRIEEKRDVERKRMIDPTKKV